MRIASAAQCREIENLSCQAYGLTSELLMEAAGLSASREIEQSYYPELKKGTTAIICGPGNNGGDAAVVARYLHSSGFRDLQIYTIVGKSKTSELFKIQLKRAESQGIRIISLDLNPEKKDSILASSLIVDGIFGLGLKRDIEAPYDQIISLMNLSKLPIVALDIPSGLDADRGVVLGQAVRAHMTITFGLAKPGFFVSEGPHLVGRLRVHPIGFAYECIRGVANKYFLFNEKLVRRYLPRRRDQSNKSDHGHLWVMAGSEGMWGAGILASTSAYRMGAGYVTWASFTDPYRELMDAPEVLTANLNSEKLWQQKKPSAVAIGPGLGVSDQVAEVIDRLKRIDDLKVVVDADALTVCVEKELFPLPSQWIITPHAGELARLLKVRAKDIEDNRFEMALEASRRSGCHVLLKGFRTVIAYMGRAVVIQAGNSALAKAGTGDVLTGMIGGLLAQGLDTLQGSATAAYIHGRMADEWVRSGQHKQSLTASDLRLILPQLMGRLQSGVVL
jgi:hydroxyethylthiazole kinase-like uncharacterized protein yjeF